MNIRNRTRISIEVFLGAVSAALLALTLRWPDWIEHVFNLAPDSGDGSAEWGWTTLFAFATLVLFADAGRAWRRSKRLLIEGNMR